MDMTQEGLEALGLNPEEAGAIVEALRQKDQALEEARQRETEMRGELYAHSLRQELQARGAMPEALQLLAGAGRPGASAAEAAEELRGRFPAFFTTETPVPTEPVNPPRGEGGLTRAEVTAMTAEQINARWPEVRAALR